MTKLSANQFGGGSDETPILDVTVYKQAFEKINQQVFIGSASMTAPTPPPSSSVNTVAATGATMVQVSDGKAHRYRWTVAFVSQHPVQQ